MNEFDGDIVGDMLGFLGGNGFATLSTAQPALSAGNNFTVMLDIDTTNGADSTVRPGQVGVRVGALASRFDVKSPIAGVDFCRGNQTLNWTSGSGPSNTTCSALVYNDTPVGYRFLVSDSDTGAGAGAGGSLLIECLADPTLSPPTRLVTLTSCCQNGNSTCTPPPP